MNRIAILYICTGQYTKFWKDFYESSERYLLTSEQKHYFVFTDTLPENIFGVDRNQNIHIIYQEALPWPHSTLNRYQMFAGIIPQLSQMDYIFFFNANMLCVQEISANEFLPSKQEELLVVTHPGFYNKPNYMYTYDRNPKSRAYVPYNQGEVYICGGLNGGISSAYIRLIEELKNRIRQDQDSGVIALWHDESHINRYILEHVNYRLLGPDYCYPEGWTLPFQPKVIVRDKGRVIDIAKIKPVYNGFLYRVTESYIYRRLNCLIDSISKPHWNAKEYE